MFFKRALVREIRERYVLARHALRDDEHALIGARAPGVLAADDFGNGNNRIVQGIR